MNLQKITRKTAPTAPTAPIGTRGDQHSAPTAPPPYKGGAVEHGTGGTTRKKLQPVKDCTHRLTDHEIELMRVMHEEYPLGHPEHIGYRKLSAIFNTPRYTVRNICLYRRRTAGL